MNTNYDKYNNAVGPQVRAPKAKAGRTIPALARCQSSRRFSARRNFSRMNFNINPRWWHTSSTCTRPGSNLHWAIKWHAVYPEAILRAGSIGTYRPAWVLWPRIRKMVLANSLTRSRYLHGSVRGANLRDISAIRSSAAAALLGRLARSAIPGQGIEEFLLMDALHRAGGGARISSSGDTAVSYSPGFIVR